MASVDTEIENLVYTQLLDHTLALKFWPREYGIDIKVLLAILVIERQQYNLKTLRRAAKKFVGQLVDLIDCSHPGGKDTWVDLATWVNNSTGFCRIKHTTAVRAMLLQTREALPVTMEDVHNYRYSPAIAIKIACQILKQHQKQWEPVAGVLKPSILATLYNISDFENRAPHSSPQVGGSIRPCIVDGVHLVGLNFGTRVEKVYNSKKLRKFLEDINL